VAPFQVAIVLLDPQLPEALDLARRLAAAAESAGADVLLDDRAERPGVKFKDADLIGLPLRLTIGGRGLKEGVFEMKWRAAKEVIKVPLAEAEARVRAAVSEKALVAGFRRAGLTAEPCLPL
jgi:prolyl-tRNA synthetase